VPSAAVGISLVAAHYADRPEANGGVGADGRLVVRGRVDDQPVVAQVAHQVEGERADGVAYSPTSLALWHRYVERRRDHRNDPIR
jgi:hypothetical protein